MERSLEVFHVRAEYAEDVVVEELSVASDKIVRATEKFVSTYERWKEKIPDLCIKLAELADRVDKDHKNVNIAKLVGGSVGTLSSVVTAAGAMLTPFTLGLGLAIAVPAGAVSVAAGLVSGGAVAADYALQSKNRDEALELIRDGQDVAREMKECLQEMEAGSAEHEEALNALAAGVEFPSQNSFLSLEEMEDLLSALIRNLSPFQERFQRIFDNWSVVKAVRKLFEKFSVDLKVPPHVVAAVAVVTVAAVITILQAVNVIVTSIDVHRGSETSLARQLRSYITELIDDQIKLGKFVDALSTSALIF